MYTAVENSIDVVTIFLPPDYSYDLIAPRVQRILRPGGWIYIALHPDFRNPEKYEEALRKQGFSNIDIIKSYPDGFPDSGDYPTPGCLIKAQKPKVEFKSFIELLRVDKDL